ncbi:hypothetical protein FM103_03160 [Corynebacterium xerosis]|nr:hypothetical protein FM103_03160 [Corynebacterium xerosis]
MRRTCERTSLLRRAGGHRRDAIGARAPAGRTGSVLAVR